MEIPHAKENQRTGKEPKRTQKEPKRNAKGTLKRTQKEHQKKKHPWQAELADKCQPGLSFGALMGRWVLKAKVFCRSLAGCVALFVFLFLPFPYSFSLYILFDALAVCDS